MNDIEKMKKEYEQKIKYAELENELNAKLEGMGIEFHIVGNSLTQKGKIHAFLTASHPYTLDKLNVLDMQNALNFFENTEDLRVYVGGDKYEALPYRMATSRTPSSPSTTLTIEWISGDYDIDAEMLLTNCGVLMQYFTTTARELSTTEVNLWLGGANRWNYETRKNFRYYTFNSGSKTRFQGGTDLQTSRGHIECIAETIKGEKF